jgi:hypothetical protein
MIAAGDVARSTMMNLAVPRVSTPVAKMRTTIMRMMRTKVDTASLQLTCRFFGEASHNSLLTDDTAQYLNEIIKMVHFPVLRKQTGPRRAPSALSAVVF